MSLERGNPRNPAGFAVARSRAPHPPGAEAPTEYSHDALEAAGSDSVPRTLAQLGNRWPAGDLGNAIIAAYGREVWLALVRDRVNLERDRTGRPRLHETAAQFQRRRLREQRGKRRPAARKKPRVEAPMLEPVPVAADDGVVLRCEWCSAKRRRGEATCRKQACIALERLYRESTGEAV